MRDRLTTDKTKIFARENPTLMSITKDELRKLYNEVFDRLQEYEVAEEQGQIIVPPCKVGDTVYCVENSQIIECVVRCFSIGPRGLDCLIVSQKHKYTRCTFIYSKNLKNLDRIKFTKEEAEAKLKGGVKE